MNTTIDYRDRIRRVMLYIEEHLADRLQLRGLATVACFSEYHFHRIFVASVGMTLQDFIHYRRLSKALDMLTDSPLRITDIAFEVGFESSAAFSTTFKRFFQITPKEYRKAAKQDPERTQGILQTLKALENPHASRRLNAEKIPYEVRVIPGMKVLAITKKGYCNGCFLEAAQSGYTSLYEYLDQNSLRTAVEKRLSIFPEHPYSLNDPHAKIHCCFSITEDLHPRPPFEVMHVEGGRYAVFSYRGPYEYLFQHWIAAYNRCFIAGDEQVRDVAPFEAYHNSPRDTAPEDLRVDIHIPIL
jgi:AraC family transcriptional regulator